MPAKKGAGKETVDKGHESDDSVEVVQDLTFRPPAPCLHVMTCIQRELIAIKK